MDHYYMGYYIINYAILSTIEIECCTKSIFGTLAGTRAHKPLVNLPGEVAGSSVRESS